MDTRSELVLHFLQSNPGLQSWALAEEMFTAPPAPKEECLEGTLSIL